MLAYEDVIIKTGQFHFILNSLKFLIPSKLSNSESLMLIIITVIITVWLKNMSKSLFCKLASVRNVKNFKNKDIYDLELIILFSYMLYTEESMDTKYNNN